MALVRFWTPTIYATPVVVEPSQILLVDHVSIHNRQLLKSTTGQDNAIQFKFGKMVIVKLAHNTLVLKHTEMELNTVEQIHVTLIKQLM